MKIAALAFGSSLALCGAAAAQTATTLNPDRDPSRIDWSQLDGKYGAVPKPPASTRIGGVVKTMINEYWRTLAKGYEAEAAQFGVQVQAQGTQNEQDQLGQLSLAQNMLSQGYAALLLSPITNSNLQPALDEARKGNVPVVDVDDAVFPDARHFVGNVQTDNGVRAARWFIEHHPQGGKVAVIEGLAGSYAARYRTAGFVDTITKDGKFTVVASVPGNWDRQKSYEAASTLLDQHPDLIGFYCNNDGMALGVLEAVKAAKDLGHVAVIGTDGWSDALKSIKAGELTGTVDSFPDVTGQIAVDVALRLLAHQDLPRVVVTPQALITKDNYDRYLGAGVDTRQALLTGARMDN
jgi:ribose transport system substrate-binding protein